VRQPTEKDSEDGERSLVMPALWVGLLTLPRTGEQPGLVAGTSQAGTTEPATATGPAETVVAGDRALVLAAPVEALLQDPVEEKTTGRPWASGGTDAVAARSRAGGQSAAAPAAQVVAEAAQLPGTEVEPEVRVPGGDGTARPQALGNLPGRVPREASGDRQPAPVALAGARVEAADAVREARVALSSDAADVPEAGTGRHDGPSVRSEATEAPVAGAAVSGVHQVVPARVERVSENVAVTQVQEQLARVLEHGVQQVRVRLEPPDLGTVDIRIRAIGGRLEVTLAASRPEVQRALEAGREGLRATLAASGFSVQRVEVQPMQAVSGQTLLGGGQMGMGWSGGQQGLPGEQGAGRWTGPWVGDGLRLADDRGGAEEATQSGLVDTRV
jgi:flagellar hook-length control protein FliK